MTKMMIIMMITMIIMMTIVIMIIRITFRIKGLSVNNVGNHRLGSLTWSISATSFSTNACIDTKLHTMSMDKISKISHAYANKYNNDDINKSIQGISYYMIWSE